MYNYQEMNAHLFINSLDLIRYRILNWKTIAACDWGLCIKFFYLSIHWTNSLTICTWLFSGKCVRVCVFVCLYWHINYLACMPRPSILKFVLNLKTEFIVIAPIYIWIHMYLYSIRMAGMLARKTISLLKFNLFNNLE